MMANSPSWVSRNGPPVRMREMPIWVSRQPRPWRHTLPGVRSGPPARRAGSARSGPVPRSSPVGLGSNPMDEPVVPPDPVDALLVEGSQRGCDKHSGAAGGHDCGSESSHHRQGQSFAGAAADPGSGGSAPARQEPPAGPVPVESEAVVGAGEGRPVRGRRALSCRNRHSGLRVSESRTTNARAPLLVVSIRPALLTTMASRSVHRSVRGRRPLIRCCPRLEAARQTHGWTMQA